MEFHRFLVDWTVLKPENVDGAVDFHGWDVEGCYDFYIERALLPRPENAGPPLSPLPENLIYEDSIAFWLALKEAHFKIH